MKYSAISIQAAMVAVATSLLHEAAYASSQGQVEVRSKCKEKGAVLVLVALRIMYLVLGLSAVHSCQPAIHLVFFSLSSLLSVLPLNHCLFSESSSSAFEDADSSNPKDVSLLRS